MHFYSLIRNSFFCNLSSYLNGLSYYEVVMFSYSSHFIYLLKRIGDHSMCVFCGRGFCYVGTGLEIKLPHIRCQMVKVDLFT